MGASQTEEAGFHQGMMMAPVSDTPSFGFTGWTLA